MESIQPCAKKALIRRAALGLQKGVIIPGLRLVNVEVCRHNVGISRQHDRRCTSRTVQPRRRSIALD
jgi:hypothetical protein